ncbi:DUF5999 family protein, partial [Streptomyces tendae]|uniref:DUF5999 family protein n=1 Tax=Streptomyces tendae TaxID=1932 RepID=UPI0033B12942
AGYPEQGWSLLCNGVLLFEDTGELLCRCAHPCRPCGTTARSWVGRRRDCPQLGGPCSLWG